MMRSTLTRPLAVIAGALVAAILVLTGAESPVRLWICLAFLLFGPGLAWVGLLDIRDAVGEWVATITASIAITFAVVMVALYTHAWAPERSFGVIIAISLAGAALQLVRAYRGTDSRPTTSSGDKADPALNTEVAP